MKRAIVLAGGGSRGAYQIGVWQAIRELNLDYQIVTGTSVGALNGALMVQNDFELAREIWTNIAVSHVLDLDLPELDLRKKEDMRLLLNTMARETVGNGGTGMTALDQTLTQYLDEAAFFASPIDYGLITVKYTTLKPARVKKQDIPKGKLNEYLLASSAFFPVFNKQKLDDEDYIDGGFYDNMPINLALEMGAKDIIAVNLKSTGRVRRINNKSNAMIRYIQPYHDLGNIVSFDKSIAARNMRLGYLDAMKALGGLEGFGYTFYFGENTKNSRVLGDILEQSMNLFSGTNKGVLNTFALKRIYKLFDLGKSTGNYLDILPVGAQYAGEIFELDDTRIYSYDEFNTELLGNYHLWMNKWQKTIPGFSILEGVSALKKKLELLDKRAIVGFLVNLIEEARKTGTVHFDLQALMVGFGKEGAAAFYLNSLLHKYFD